MKHRIAQNGDTEYYIVTSEFAHSAELFAASQLQKYLNEALNIFMPYFSDRCPKRGKEILIGKTARNKCDDVDTAYLGDEGFTIRSVGEDVAIFGNTARGTVYGVFSFLERFLGYRCYTKDVETIEHKSELILDELNISETPAFEYRESYSRFAWDIEFAVKNKLNANLAPIPKEMGGRMKFFNCHHSFFDLVPPKYYKQSHPEYYSVSEDGDGKQLCLSHPDVFKIARQTLIGWIKENPDCRVFSVAQNDEYGYCRCEKCRQAEEYYGSPSGIIIDFVNRLAQSIEKEYPDVLIHTFAYQWSTKAPRNVRVHKNVMVRLCNIECRRGLSFEEYAQKDEGAGAKTAKEFLRNITEWSAISDRVYLWDYVVYFWNYLMPMLPITAIAENIRTYKRTGIKGLLMQGNFSYGGDASMGDLKNYLLAKLMWNPELDEKAIVREFIYGVFGKGAPYLHEYVQLMEQAITGSDAWIYDFPDAEYFKPEYIERGTELFEKAMAAETDPVIRKRIEREKLAMDYFNLACIESDEERAEKADEFYEHLKSLKMTEIIERVDLRLSIQYVKDGRYTRGRKGFYNSYYIVK